MIARCNLNISVVGLWWETQLGLAPRARSEEKQAALRRTFPDLITFNSATLPRHVPDPNRGLTLLKSLGLEVGTGARGVTGVTPLQPEQVMALIPPDFASNPVIAVLREAIRATNLCQESTR